MKKKILIYTGQLYMGGIERVMVNYLKKLAQEPNLDITFLVKENDPDKNIFESEVPKNIKITYIKSESLCERSTYLAKNKKKLHNRLLYQWYLLYNRLYTKRWIRRYFKTNKFDLIVDFDGSLGRYMEKSETPIVGWVHYSLAGKTKKKYRQFNKRYEKYDKAILICDDMKKEFEELFPKHKEKGMRIYNPMDFDIIEKKIEDTSELSANDQKLLEDDFFVAVSRLASAKNRVGLVEIYKKLKDRGVKEKLYIIGDGPDRVNIEKKIKELGLEEEVLLLGERKNPFPFMKRAKLFLHTSKGEGLPTVFIEAMLCDTIVVAYDCPTGPREILMDGKAGGLVALNDSKAFEEKVLEILNSDELQNSIKKEMQKKLQEFSYKEIRKDLLKLFDKK